eukprot:1704856-Prymnesium_polylepis.1
MPNTRRHLTHQLVSEPQTFPQQPSYRSCSMLIYLLKIEDHPSLRPSHSIQTALCGLSVNDMPPEA